MSERGGNAEGIQQADIPKQIPFEFCHGPATDPSVRLGGPALDANQGLLLYQQLLSFQAAADQVRVRVQARAADGAIEASGALPIRSGASTTVFRFPLRGAWYIQWGPTPHAGHRWWTMQEFALDIGRLGASGLDHNGRGTKFADYYGYGADVLAAADGRVVAVVNTAHEDPATLRRPDEDPETYARRHSEHMSGMLQAGPAAALGNHVVIAHNDGEHSVYAHLQPGSIRVKLGDPIESGQVLGRLGSSGQSTRPHLHFQVCDGPDPVNCMGIPVSFRDLEIVDADELRVLQSGDLVVAP